MEQSFCGVDVVWLRRFVAGKLCCGAFCNGTLSGENFFTGDITTFSDRTF